MNPKGIPCLYLSTERETAMTEVRPRIGSHVSVAVFVTVRDLRVVDCSSAGKLDAQKLDWYMGFSEPERDEWETCVWDEINSAFSQPVTSEDDLAGYAPTQVLAETFRNAGFDGVIYGSKLGSGKTVALFDLAVAEPRSFHLFVVEEVKPKFRLVANPHFTDCSSDGNGGDEVGAGNWE